MNLPGESLDEKKRRLAAEIAQQRVALGNLYEDLRRPLRYTEQAMRGFGFLRQNPWVLTVVPATFSIGSTLLGLLRGRKDVRQPRAFRDLFQRDTKRRVEREAERETRGLLGHAIKWGGHGVKLFRLYRRVRKYLP